MVPYIHSLSIPSVQCIQDENQKVHLYLQPRDSRVLSEHSQDTQSGYCKGQTLSNEAKKICKRRPIIQKSLPLEQGVK